MVGSDDRIDGDGGSDSVMVASATMMTVSAWDAVTTEMVTSSAVMIVGKVASSEVVTALKAMVTVTMVMVP